MSREADREAQRRHRLMRARTHVWWIHEGRTRWADVNPPPRSWLEELREDLGRPTNLPDWYATTLDAILQPSGPLSPTGGLRS